MNEILKKRGGENKKSKIWEAIWLGYITFAEIFIECEQ